MHGADSPITDKTPDFIKSIPTWKAIEDTTLVAYEMNGRRCRTSMASRRVSSCRVGPEPIG